MSKYWEIEEGKVDSAGFLQALWRHFPQATTFYVEGTSVAGDVMDFYRLHKEEGDYLPDRQTLFPRSRKFRCRFSASFVAGLSALAQRHAEAELLDHVALYDGSTEVLSWHDAFANVLLVSRSIPERTVSAFAADLGLPYS
jgi:hypothetical protein